MCRIYVFLSEIFVHEISGNLRPKKFATPKNFRKFRTKKKSLDFLWFSYIDHVDFHVAGLFVRHIGGAHGCCLFLVLNFAKFWTEILQGQPQKICRRVRTLAFEAIRLGLARLERTFCSLAHLYPAAALAMSLAGMSLAGNSWLGLSLASYVANWLSAGWFCNWLLAGWLAICLPM